MGPWELRVKLTEDDRTRCLEPTTGRRRASQGSPRKCPRGREFASRQTGAPVRHTICLLSRCCCLHLQRAVARQKARAPSALVDGALLFHTGGNVSDSVFKLFVDDQGHSWRISALTLQAWTEGAASTSLLFAREGEQRVVRSAPSEWWDLTRREMHQLLANSQVLPPHVRSLSELREF